MATLQVKSIDDKLYKCLGNKAKMDNRSISQEVIAILKEQFSRPRKNNSVLATDRFLEMCGTWKDDRRSEIIIMDIRSNRKAKNRFLKDIF